MAQKRATDGFDYCRILPHNDWHKWGVLFPGHIYSLHLETAFQLTDDGAQFEIHVDLQ